MHLTEPIFCCLGANGPLNYCSILTIGLFGLDEVTSIMSTVLSFYVWGCGDCKENQLRSIMPSCPTQFTSVKKCSTKIRRTEYRTLRTISWLCLFATTRKERVLTTLRDCLLTTHKVFVTKTLKLQFSIIWFCMNFFLKLSSGFNLSRPNYEAKSNFHPCDSPQFEKYP